MSRVAIPLGALALLLVVTHVASAQGAITGVVKDVSGGVLPGVTVEASSPVLIERVRSVTTDDTGQYRIVDLRPGAYSVTFTLPGFKSVKRDGIQLTGTFVATVSADLSPGGLDETITVTGQSPIVDVQSVRVQQTMSDEIIAAIPSSRNAAGLQSLIPGLNVTQAGVAVGGGDSGGITGGMGGLAGTIHGGNTYGSRTKTDGLNTDFTGQAAAGGQLLNTAGAQEVVINTSGGLGEAEGAGVILNIIPRDGGNTFSGSLFGNTARDWMQDNNFTQALKDQGLRTPGRLNKLYDVSAMGGGRIIRDKLWFYLTVRQVVSDTTVPGMWVNKNAGRPDIWAVDFDLSKPAFTDTRDRHEIVRLTWQATSRQKLTGYWQQQHNYIGKEGGGTPTQTPEATGLTSFKDSKIQQLTWTFTISNKLLAEAGIGTYLGVYDQSGGGGPRIGGIGGVNNPEMIQQLEQTGSNIAGCNCSIPGLVSRHPGLANGGFSRSDIGTREWRASIAYVSGSHNMKFGYQGGFSTPTKNYFYDSQVIQVRTNNGVPNQITQNLAYPGWLRTGREVIPVNFYAQDQWTMKRLTLQGGVRYDNGITNYTSDPIGGPDYLLMPVRVHFPKGSTQGINWRDVTPRAGVAYDLFGNGKTAVKASIGKYMEGLSSLFGLDMNPIFRIPTMTTRPWLNPTNFNFTSSPGCDLRNPNAQPDCGPVNNRTFGTEVFNTNYDANMVTGWGSRPYVWSTGVSVQQELVRGVALTVGYYRNSWGNLSMVDNTLTALSDYTPYSIRAPLDPRLPGGGGHVVSGLFDLNPNKVGQVLNLHQLSSAVGPEMVNNWQGVDVSLNARFAGITVQGGTSTGRRLTDACGVRELVPERTSSTAIVPAGGLLSSLFNPYCRVVEPYRTSATGLATYLIPKIDVQASLTWQSNPGPELAANYVASNAVIAAGPQPLGRNLSGGANVTVNLIQPGTMYGERRNNFDMRLSKIQRFGNKRVTLSLDAYNLTNADTVLAFNNAFVPGGSWLTPTRIASPRYAKVGAQFDF
jgi:hypothetical protein